MSSNILFSVQKCLVMVFPKFALRTLSFRWVPLNIDTVSSTFLESASCSLLGVVE